MTVGQRGFHRSLMIGRFVVGGGGDRGWGCRIGRRAIGFFEVGNAQVGW